MVAYLPSEGRREFMRQQCFPINDIVRVQLAFQLLIQYICCINLSYSLYICGTEKMDILYNNGNYLKEKRTGHYHERKKTR